MSRWQANLMLLLAGGIWGMAFIAQSQAMDSIGPFLFVGLRFLIATVVVLPFVWLEAKRQTSPQLERIDWLKFALIGLVLFAGMASQQVGLLTTTVTNSGFLTGLYVVFTPVVAIVLFNDRPHPIVWPAAVLSFCGIFLLSGGSFTDLQLGDLLTIGSAICFALQVVLIARFVGQSGRPLALSCIQFLVVAVMSLTVASAIEPVSWPAIKLAAWELLFAGVFASGLAFTLQVVAQRYTSAAQAAIFLSSEAPFAAIFAALLLHERLALLGLIGCALIFTAMLAVELWPELRRRGLDRQRVKNGEINTG